MPDSKKPSGAEFRRRRRERDAEAIEADEDLDPEDIGDAEDLIEQLGPPPNGAVGRIAWGQRAAALMAWLTLRHRGVPLLTRFKAAKGYLDTVAMSTAKAITDEQLLKLEQSEGLEKRPEDDELEDLPAPARGTTGPPPGGEGSGSATAQPADGVRPRDELPDPA
jgi:hypothetical protein